MGERRGMIAAVELGPEMVDGDLARQWLLQVFKGGQMVCPACGRSTFSAVQQLSFREGRRVKCECGKWFIDRSGTPIDHSSLSHAQAAVLIHLLACRLPAAEIAARVGCSADTVTRLQRRLASRQRADVPAGGLCV